MKNSILEKARWLRDVALATSKNNGARVARERLKYAAAFMLIFTLGVGNVLGAITPLSLPHDFGDVGKGSFTNALGCTYTISGDNYSSDPKLCFKTEGNHLTIQLAEAPCCVSYHIKGNSFSGGTFKLQESSDGSSYTDVATYTSLGATQNEKKDLKSTTRYIKFVYTTKSSGNVGLGSISIDKACPAVDVTDGDPVILPAGSESYTTSDWSANGAPTSYIDGTYNINGYCVSLVQAGDNANANGLQMKKSSNGVLTISGITSTSGVDVDVVIGSSTGMSVALTGATSKTGQTTGTTTISTSSTSATLVITATSGSASYVKYIKITPKTASCSANPTAGAAQIKGSVNCSTTSIPVETTTGANDAAWGPGSNCTWSDYGFVWSLGTNVATPSLVEATGAAATNCNKVPVGSSGTATSWDGTLAASNSTVPTSFTAGQAYNFRAYGKNNYASGTYQYSDVVTITPRSISLGSPTGGEISAKVNNTDVTLSYYGQTVTIAAAAASSHYTFASWTITKEGGGSVTPADASSASTTFTMPDDNVTITATFNEDAHATVNFYNDKNGNTPVSSIHVYQGLNPTPPTLTDGTSGDACSSTSDKHYGWTRTLITGTVATQELLDARTGNEVVYAKGCNLPAIAAGDLSTTINYYAVWAVRSGNAAVTKTDEFTYTSFFSACNPSGSNTNGTYVAFTNKSGSQSDAVYAGKLMQHGNGVNCKEYIQMKGDNDIGLITTTTGGTAKKVTVDWNSAMTTSRTINVYGKSSAYSTAADLYNEDNDGELLGTITWASQNPGTELTITGDYEHIGIRSSSSAIYLNSIDIDWSSGGGYTYSTFLTTCCTQHNINLTNSGSISGAGTFHAEISSSTVTSSCSGNTITLVKDICSGYTVGDWTVTYVDGEEVEHTVTVTNNQFMMPDYPVTVSLSTTAKTDHFIDRLHNTTNYTGDGYAVSGCDQTVPTLSDAGSPSDETCIATHYKFVGWVPSTCFNANGTVDTSADGYEIITGGTEHWNASGKNYYAVWAEIK